MWRNAEGTRLRNCFNFVKMYCYKEHSYSSIPSMRSTDVGKVFPVPLRHRESDGIAPPILNYSTRWKCVFQLRVRLYSQAAYQDGASSFSLQRKKCGTFDTALRTLTKQTNKRWQHKSEITAVIITIIRHELGLDRTISATSNCRFKGLPSCLRPLSLFGLYSNIIFWHPVVVNSCYMSQPFWFTSS